MSHPRSRGHSIHLKIDKRGKKTEFSRVDAAPHGVETPVPLARIADWFELHSGLQPSRRMIEAHQPMGGSSVAHGGHRAPSPVQKSSESLQPQQRGNYNDDLPGRYTSSHGVSTPTPLNWLISRDWLVGFDPISSQLFRPSRVSSHPSRIRQTFAMRAQFN